MRKQAAINNAEFRALGESQLQMLSNYFIAFALPTVENQRANAHLGGSGTLITIDGVEGILTAKHVINSLKKSRYVGLIVSSPSQPEPHRLLFDIDLAAEVSLPTEEPQPEGPDLGFIVPPPNVLSALRARKSFYNLSKSREAMAETPPSIELGFWVLSGSAAEWVRDGVPEHGFSRVKIFKVLHGAGIVTQEYDKGGFDYLIFKVSYNEPYDGPQRFRGFSGGGLWQLLINADDGEFRVTDRLLSGVAFYETDIEGEGDNAAREIRCHGRRSLCKALPAYVRSQKLS